MFLFVARAVAIRRLCWEGEKLEVERRQRRVGQLYLARSSLVAVPLFLLGAGSRLLGSLGEPSLLGDWLKVVIVIVFGLQVRCLGAPRGRLLRRAALRLLFVFLILIALSFFLLALGCCRLLGGLLLFLLRSIRCWWKGLRVALETVQQLDLFAVRSL